MNQWVERWQHLSRRGRVTLTDGVESYTLTLEVSDAVE